MEQAPGPRGSPQLPQAPGPLEPAQSDVAPTPNAENCLSSDVALHEGQAGAVEAWTNNSNRRLHSRHTYSKIGMVVIPPSDGHYKKRHT